MIGNYVREYKIVSELGRGGMGIVYLAEHKHLGKFAIKALALHLAVKDQFRDRFIREAKAQFVLKHPNIVQLYNFFEEQGIFYLVMEYVDGEPLDKKLQRSTKLSVDESLRITCDVLNALSFAHSKELIHRDIKPSNVIVSLDGTARIFDFGIARQVSENVTITGAQLGTPAYMSPEQIMGDKATDHRTDIYSVGCMLYEFLSGSPPFQGNSSFEIQMKHINETPLPIFKSNKIAIQLSNVVLKALAKKPDDRYYDCSSLINELTYIIKNINGNNFVDISLDLLDIEKYTQARPYFEEIYNQCGKQGKSLKVFLKLIIDNYGVEIRPYILHYIKEKKSNATKFGAEFICPITGMMFIKIEGGIFEMGDIFGDGYDDQKPIHKVQLNAFYMGKHPVTQSVWQKVMENNPSQFNNDNHPIEHVSWTNAQIFIRKLNEILCKDSYISRPIYRLPTEAEWEFVARSGGNSDKWSGAKFEKEIVEYCWFRAEYTSTKIKSTQPVGQKKPNSFGVYDLSGNVWEWCQDRYDGTYYRDSSFSNPQGPDNGGSRVIRGGSWRSKPHLLRTTFRHSLLEEDSSDFTGFRLVFD